jgi:hypothetical protein
MLDNGSKDPDPYPNSSFRNQEFGFMNIRLQAPKPDQFLKLFELLEHCFQLSLFTSRNPSSKEGTSTFHSLYHTAQYRNFEK